MSQKKDASDRLKSTLNELDFAIEQWDRLTSKPEGEQVCRDTELQRKTSSLLKELRTQILEFETQPETTQEAEPRKTSAAFSSPAQP
jgi:hypothetical protein